MKFSEFAEKYLSGEVKANYYKALGKEGRLNMTGEDTPVSNISRAFTWAGTDEGHDYWATVATNIGNDVNFYAPKAPSLDKIIEDSLALLGDMRKLTYGEYRKLEPGSKVDYDDLVVALKNFVVEV